MCVHTYSGIHVDISMRIIIRTAAGFGAEGGSRACSDSSTRDSSTRSAAPSPVSEAVSSPSDAVCVCVCVSVSVRRCVNVCV